MQLIIDPRSKQWRVEEDSVIKIPITYNWVNTIVRDLEIIKLTQIS